MPSLRSGSRSNDDLPARRGRDRRSVEGGFLTLIGLLIVIVIIGILISMYGMPGGGGGSSSTAPVSIAGGAKQRAEDVLCRNNLQQLRAAIQIYQGNNQTNPPSLDSLNSGVTLSCPVGGEPYGYDPATGQVHCVHPGHESY